MAGLGAVMVDSCVQFAERVCFESAGFSVGNHEEVVAATGRIEEGHGAEVGKESLDRWPGLAAAREISKSSTKRSGMSPNATTLARRNYVGTSPLTVASGRNRVVKAGHIKNRRLYDVIGQWAFGAISTSPGCRAFYDQRRAAKDLHHEALRALANRLVGYLHGCLASRMVGAAKRTSTWVKHPSRCTPWSAVPFRPSPGK